MYCGDYISGDYDSPYAPWNERYEECPHCKGTGHRYFAEDIRTWDEVEVSEETYYGLPETPEEAESIGRRFCRAEDGERTCPECDGSGERLF